MEHLKGLHKQWKKKTSKELLYLEEERGTFFKPSFKYSEQDMCHLGKRNIFQGGPVKTFGDWNYFISTLSFVVFMFNLLNYHLLYIGEALASFWLQRCRIFCCCRTVTVSR